MENLANKYDPKDFEEKWYRHWEEKGYFKADATSQKKSYTVVIPPPNVTSILHMGHGLNNTIQDVMIRYKRMDGFNALWVPGTDHAGIATQNVVERDLAKENKTRTDLGREAFIKRVWQWKEKYGGEIINQLKKIGSSCDWSRTRFTMDEGLSDAVKEAFVRLYEAGLIYKGEYIINWCPRCGTALADEEVEHETKRGKLYHLKYYLKDSEEYLVVATTRPETLLGDTAVAVHPEDPRYQKFIGKKVILPLVGRELPVIADAYVDREFGTGALKITPAHDHNDFELGLKHKLPIINVLNPDATMNAEAGKYQGQDRFVCQKNILVDLEAASLIEKVEEYDKSVGGCYRCDTVVEPYVSSQWFVRMQPLAEKAIEVVESDQVKLVPGQWKKVYLNWMTNIRDWCISRQIWWGHRIPAYHCERCSYITVAKEHPGKCKGCGSSHITQDPDVLDTWFSSWLWPLSTLGWPEKTPDLKAFYPTTFLSTAPEILFFWVARMIMAGLYFEDQIPFSEVYLHATVCDSEGRKMSKSLGNGIDPLEVVEEYGADSLRFSVLYLAPIGQRIRLAKENFEMGSRFANKIWNAAKFILMNAAKDAGAKLDKGRFNDWDKWILMELDATIRKIREYLDTFRFSEAANELYHFIWSKFCDWYLEVSKGRIYSKEEQEKKAVMNVLLYVMDASLRLLHPVMPFITEEIWQKLPGRTGESIMLADFPQAGEWGFEEAREHIALLQEVIYHVRNIRGDAGITPDKKVSLIFSAEASLNRIIEKYSKEIQALAKVEEIEFKKVSEKPEKTMSAVGSGFEIFVKLEGMQDLEKERERIQKELSRLEKDLERTRSKLENPEFRDKAPEAIVAKEREKFADCQQKMSKLEELLKELN